MKPSGLIASLLAAIPIAGATITPAFGSTGAAHSLPNGDSRIYYSGPDGGIHELIGPPSTNPSSTNTDQVLIAAGKAMPDTPLATYKRSSNGGYTGIWLYYIDVDGTTLREYYWSGGWQQGALSSANIKVEPGSRLLYTVGGDDSSNTPRVGFICAGGMSLCEAYWDGNWHVHAY